MTLEEALSRLPKTEHDPAPWNLAKSNVSVNLPAPSHGKIRQEGGGRSPRVLANARIIAAAPTLYNLAIEALLSLAEVRERGDDSPETAETLNLLVESLAWIHKDPTHGAELREALGLEPLEEDRRAKYR